MSARTAESWLLFPDTANISGVTIRNGGKTDGFLNGGGIVNRGTLTLTNSTVSGNSAGSLGSGGGIFSFGTLTLTNSTVSGNSAGIHGGGISNTGDDGTANLFNHGYE